MTWDATREAIFNYDSVLAENAKLRAAIKAVERAYMGNDPEARIKPWQHMIALAKEQKP